MPSNDKQYLQEAADKVVASFPDGEGFILLAVPYGDGGATGRVKYISNLDRKDAIKVLKAWLIKASGEEDWMKHID